MDRDADEMLPRTASRTLPLDCARMASIESQDDPRVGHALSPQERALILDAVPQAQKELMYSASLRKRSLDLHHPHPTTA